MFDGEAAFRSTLSDAIVSAPRELAPMDALLCAFRAVEPTFERNRSFTEPRREIIACTPALRERVLTKTEHLISAVSGALGRWGVDDALATLAAQVGIAALGYAVKAWFDDPGPGLDTHLTHAFATLHSLSPNKARSDA
ncbi:hypothetical protein [Lichenicoccus sp.]|uniref:acyl-CoA-like ligand-binding transcription factor n=1 Tax=Lichenicoccus sp. TaxID=2781899 RepID=UPI003D146A76